MGTRNVISLFDYSRRTNIEKSALKNGGTYEMEQMSLPFPCAHPLMLLMTSDFKSSDEFLRFAAATLPKLILDMRVAPRLDFIGTNRPHSFNVLKSLGILYKDMLGRLEINSYEEGQEKYEDLWKSLNEVLGALEVSSHPIFLFFDDLGFRSQCNRRLSHLYEIALLDTHAIEEISLTEQLRM